MKMKMLVFGLLFSAAVCNAQKQGENSVNADSSATAAATISHRVEMGETVMLIAKKYHIAPKDIYNLNPTAVDGISYNMVLSIPAGKIAGKVKKEPAATAQAYTSEKD